MVTLIEEFAKQRGIGIEIEHVPVNTDEEAQAHKFIGGPTVRINGLDVDPAARGVTEYGFG